MLFSRNQIVLAKVETTAGVDAAPTGVDAILCEVLNPTVDGQSLENNVVRASISKSPTKYTGLTVKATIVVRAKGSGVVGTPPEFGSLLRSCALVETVTEDESEEPTGVEYTPANSAANMKTCTIYIYKDGLRIKATGCMGEFKASGRYCEYPTFTFDMQGVFAGCDDSANPTPTYDETEPVEIKAEGFTFGSWADAVAREFGFETGNELVTRGNINAATGLMPYVIVSRDPKWNANIEAVLEATNSFWADAQSGTTKELHLTHGTVDGNIIEFSAPKANFGYPGFNEENSLNMYSLSGQLLESSVEDNFKLIFK